MKKPTFKVILFGVLLILLTLPMFQHFTQFASTKELKGAVVPTKYDTLSSEGWFSQKYQKNTTDFLNDHFGFRPDFVRINNQIDFSFYGKANANGVIIGKEWYLYEYNYIKAYLGLDFVGDSIIEEKTRKLRFIQDTLAKQGKELLVVLAIGKGSYLPEYFPDSIKHKKTRTNYTSYIEQFSKQGVNYIDFQNWFLGQKDTTPYPIYGKGGIHWSKYAEILAADSMLRKMKTMTNSSFPDLIIDGFDVESENKEGDYDIGEGLNIITQAETFPMAYPKISITQPENNKTKTLFMADSYYWGMFNKGFSNNLFNGGQFWFYNESIYPDSFDSPLSVSDIDIKQEVEKNDFIVLMSTDANLYKFAFGFIDELYDAYHH